MSASSIVHLLQPALGLNPKHTFSWFIWSILLFVFWICHKIVKMNWNFKLFLDTALSCLLTYCLDSFVYFKTGLLFPPPVINLFFTEFVTNYFRARYYFPWEWNRFISVEKMRYSRLYSFKFFTVFPSHFQVCYSHSSSSSNAAAAIWLTRVRVNLMMRKSSLTNGWFRKFVCFQSVPSRRYRLLKTFFRINLCWSNLKIAVGGWVARFQILHKSKLCLITLCMLSTQD